MEVSTSTTPTYTENTYDYINGFLMNPSAFIIVALVVIAYIIIFVTLGNSEGGQTVSDSQMQQSAASSSFLVFVVVCFFVVLLIINGVQYFLGLNIIASLKNVFLGEPHIDIVVEQPKGLPLFPGTTVPEIKYEKQVFNIPGNYYGYEDAKTLCAAYGSRLATYNEIEDSYNKGGEWCNYGWSEGQMGLFPTQKSTFENLQTIPGHEHDCGRPGINGGYMANPEIKYGVNCYGFKPKITEEEEQMMQTNSPYPKTEKDILMEKRVDYWKGKISDILISPFNYKNWSKM